MCKWLTSNLWPGPDSLQVVGSCPECWPSHDFLSACKGTCGLPWEKVSTDDATSNSDEGDHLSAMIPDERVRTQHTLVHIQSLVGTTRDCRTRSTPCMHPLCRFDLLQTANVLVLLEHAKLLQQERDGLRENDYWYSLTQCVCVWLLSCPDFQEGLFVWWCVCVRVFVCVTRTHTHYLPTGSDHVLVFDHPRGRGLVLQ